MLRALLVATGVATLCIATLLLAEGIYAVARWGKLDGSVTYQTYQLLAKRLGGRDVSEGPPFTRLLELEDVEPLLPKLKAAGVALGNSPFDELITDAAAVNRREDGCLVQKPDVHKTMTYLRTNLYNPLDPMTMFYDSDRQLDPEIAALVEIYGLRRISHTSNSLGERTTLPAVTADRKVIVAGDSVANGSMVDDAETIASRLQGLDPARQYVNLGVGGADTADIICMLEKAAKRYDGQIEELIYVYCENDFQPKNPYGTPEEALAWLRGFVSSRRIGKVTVVYAPYIYNVVPQYTRFRQYRGGRFKTHAKQRATLERLTREAGFGYVDIAEIALAEIDRVKTQFGALSVFSDHVHLSPYGTSRLAERLLEGPAGPSNRP